MHLRLVLADDSYPSVCHMSLFPCVSETLWCSALPGEFRRPRIRLFRFLDIGSLCVVRVCLPTGPSVSRGQYHRYDFDGRFLSDGLWPDKVCIDQTNIDDLYCLWMSWFAQDVGALWVSYSARLWCIWELFAMMAVLTSRAL